MGNNRAGKQNVKSVKCDEKKDKLLSVFLAITILFLSSIIMVNTGSNDASASEPDQQPKIEYIAINTIIDNNYAITNILEKFKNPCSYSIDETFQVQIPAKAFISNFSLCINNETHYSQIVSKDEGREKFEEAVIKGSNAGLVEAKDKNIFSYSVSISPKSEIIVGLRYEQFLEKSLGGYEYLIPLSGAAFGSNMDKFSVDITLRSKLLVTACKIEDYFADANLTFVSSHEAKVAYETSLPIPKNDFRMNYGLATPPSNGTMLNYNDGAQEYFFHIFSPQRTDLGGEVMAKEIIFVLDKSGSMSGNKISQLKSAFDEIINQLHSKDSFNIIMFDSVIEKYKSDLIRASERNKLDAVDYINEVEARGATNINEALLSALDMFSLSETKMPIIVMLTDGLPTMGETNTKTIRQNVLENNNAKVTLYCLGFGFDLDFPFLKAMSLENFGIAFRIYENKDASAQITDFYDTISTPLLRGLTFSYSDGAYEVYPTYVEQLFEGAEIVVVGKYNGTSRMITASVSAMSWEGKKTFKETFKLSGPTGISFESQLSAYGRHKGNPNDITPTIEETSWNGKKTGNERFKLKNSVNNSFIPRFWAYAKIRYLLDELAIEGNNNSKVENVTSLALTYGFVTPFTSLLVDTTVDEPEAKDDNSGSYTNDGTNDGTYSGGDNSGSEGESEAEAESESESESEAEGEGEGESESESESEKEQKPGYSNLEQMEKSPNYYPTENETIGYYEKEQFGDSKPGAENEAGSVNKSKPENDTDRESIIRIEAEPEISRYTKITISITNSNENICKIYWLGIHFDWQAEDQYCVCTDLSVEKTKTIAPGDKESFYIYIEVPGSVKLGYHSYNILFRNDLQDDWFGGWNGYYWQSETKANFNVNENNKVYDEPSTSSDDSSSNSPNPYLHPAALQPEVTVHESKTEEETKNDMALPIEPVVDNSEDGALPVMDASNERIKDTNAHEEIRETGDNTQPTENNDDTLIALFLALTIIIIIIISFIYIRKKRYRRQQLVRSELIVKYIKKHPGTDVHKILKALDHSMADIDDILDKLEGKDAIKSRPAGKKRLFYIKDTKTILKT